MKILDKPINNELRGMLDSYRHLFLESVKELPDLVSGNLDDNKGDDLEYLKMIMSDPTFTGNAEKYYYYGSKLYLDLIHAFDVSPKSLDLCHQLRKVDAELFSYMNEDNQWHFAARHYYPPGSYMSWHDNRMAYGYNIMFTWSEKGDGSFKYWDNKTEEIVEVLDTPGWSTKVAYYGPSDMSEEDGSFTPTDDSFFHCFSNNDNRFTFAFYTRDESLWKKGIEKI